VCMSSRRWVGLGLEPGPSDLISELVLSLGEGDWREMSVILTILVSTFFEDSTLRGKV
jgi:hypothetical protein